MVPYSVQGSDALFNLGFAVSAAITQAPQTYIAMNGRVFLYGDVEKNKGAADRQHRDMAQVEAVGPASLVIAAYALAEIHASAQDAAVMALWRAAHNMLVLVEPGTPAGFARLRNARDRLLGAGAVQVAPCPHARACPLTGEDWCHFSVRLPRRRLHMHAKQARVPFEDERYAYLAVSRDGRVSGEPRILAPPKDAKPGLTFKLCTAEGLETRHVARRDAATYKQVRKRKWGDVL